MPKPKKTAPAAETITAYKGFNPDWTCRGFRFEVGKTYEHAGEVAACLSGFHACENPWDVLSYYPLIADDGRFSRFASVTQSGAIARHEGDSKIASGRITIDIELSMPEFIVRAVDWIVALTKGAVGLSDNGDNGAQIGSSGDDARIGSSGNGAQIGSSGDGAQIGSSGYGAQIGSSGDDARIGSSGYGARIGSSGNGAQIGSSGDGARIGSSGNGAQIGSSGDGAQIGSSGYGAQIGSSGDDARIGSSGNSARIVATGTNAVVAAAGTVTCFKLGVGGCAAIPWHDGTRTRFATVYVGEGGIEPDTAYRINGNGKPVRA